MEPEPDVFCNQARPQVEELGHQPSHKPFDLQFVLPVECSGTGAQWNPYQRHQRDFIQQLMGTDAEYHSQILAELGESTKLTDWASWRLEEIKKSVGL